MPLPTWMSLSEDPGLGDEDRPAADQSAWLVDNSGMKSKAKGICYRNSPNVWDKSAGVGVAEFGTVVHGKLVCSAEGDWVEVGKAKYLPLKVQDHEVLVSATSTQPDKEMSLSIYELAARREAEAALEAEGLKEQVQVPEPKEWVPVEATPPAEKPDAMPLVAGPGEWYTVVSKHVNVRSTPSAEGHVANNKFLGELVQLYEWDESGRWRHCLEGLGGEPGWMMVEHPEFGVLLRSLDALGHAARNGDLVVLRQQLRRTKYRDLQGAPGQTALRIAAEKAHYDCIVALIESGMDPKLFLRMASHHGGQGVLNFKEKGPTLALINALCDLRYDEGDFKVAMGALTGEIAETAEMIIDRLAYKNSLNRDDDADSAAGDAEEEGEDHLVIHQRLAVRGKPDTNSDIVASLQQSDVVKLLEPDETGQWRRHYVKEVKLYGWVLLGHEKFGALLKPLTPEAAAEARARVRKTDWSAVFHGSPGKGSPGRER